MANKNKKAAANHFALLERDDPGDTRLEQPQAAPSSLTQELFGGAYPSAWEIMRNRQKQYGAPPAANAKGRADSKKGAQGQGGSARKQKGGRQSNGSAAVNDGAPAPRLYDPAEFPSLK